jgi:DNA-binding NtrC family response regulator
VNAPATAIGRLLIVEDDPVLLDQLSWALKDRFQILRARDAVEGRNLSESEPDLFLFDMRLPPTGEVDEGLNLLKEVRKTQPDATVVMMSGEGERRDALKAMELGAFDFFQKPIDPAELRVILARALERRRLLDENRALKDQAREDGSFGKLVGKSAPMQRLFREIEKVAPSDVTVLIQGESGTGKELVAHLIHAGSGRRDRRFIAVNVSALPESLAEAELFGHERGAFTGAIASRPGRFELAHGGTLFLDEIGTLSPGVQAKLLRALESREIERVGGRRPIPVDFRLISATNEDLETRVGQGTFREDLFYRINTIPIRIPPLRERGEDLVLLAEYFLETLAARHNRPVRKLSPAVLGRFRAHPWKGNVRELEHVVEMLVLFAEGGEISEDDLPRALREVSPRTGAAALPFSQAVADFERRLLAETIAQEGGVKARAARRLGLDGNQIKYLCRKYGL